MHKNQYQLTQLSELKDYSLLSWQDTKIHLGVDYANMVNDNPRYSETFDQSIQVKMLFLERYEDIQMDAHIFDYYRAKLAMPDSVDMSQKVDRFAFLGVSSNGFCLNQKKCETNLINNYAYSNRPDNIKKYSNVICSNLIRGSDYFGVIEEKTILSSTTDE